MTETVLRTVGEYEEVLRPFAGGVAFTGTAPAAFTYEEAEKAYYLSQPDTGGVQMSDIEKVLVELRLERGKFQRETLRTSKLTRKLQEVVENLCPQHGPGSWGRHGCRYCNLLLDIQELLARPINAEVYE